jgi:hypothetical protein
LRLVRPEKITDLSHYPRVFSKLYQLDGTLCRIFLPVIHHIGELQA